MMESEIPVGENIDRGACGSPQASTRADECSAVNKALPQQVGSVRVGASEAPLRVLIASIAVIVICVVATFSVTVPYVAEEPGITVNILGEGINHRPILEITGAKVYPHPGQLRMVTVSVASQLTLAQALELWQHGAHIVPRAVVFPPDKNDEQVNQENSALFTGSEDNAHIAALHYLHQDLHHVHITVNLPGIGGPSAGLMFTLSIITLLTPEDLLAGKNIAGTGEIDSQGKVGMIGGITLKLAAAHRDGAEYFFVPEGNCAQALTRVPTGLTLIKVRTVSDAVQALRHIQHHESVPGC